MTILEIEAELAQLDELIARPRDVGHYVNVLELRQAKRRRAMLQTELKRLNEEKPKVVEA